MLSLCGQRLAPGQKVQTWLEPLPGARLPVTLICGAKPGKTILITAQIHSGEYPGTPAVIRCAKELDPAQTCGNLLLFHCVNVSGFWARSDSLLPEDGGNLNACYPGDPQGSFSQRLADFFVREVFPQVDFVLDLHSGSQQEPLTPCLFFPQWEAVREISLRAARALDIPYLIQSSATSGEYSYAAHALGIPGLLLERGHSGFCEEQWIAEDCHDLRLLLAHLGAYPYDKSRSVKQQLYVKTIYLEAQEDGLWYSAVEPDQPVKKGQLLGVMEDFFGRELRRYYAEADGLVFYHCCGLSVKAGRNLVAYGIEEAPLP